MKKIIGLLVLLLLVTGCFGGTENDESNGNEIDREERGRRDDIRDLEEVAGVDPLYPERFPHSVRRNYVADTFVIYVAEATPEKVLAYYRTQAMQRGIDFTYEELPEDHPYWFYAYEDFDQRTGGFSGTLGESDVCPNCVEWVLYASEWPEN